MNEYDKVPYAGKTLDRFTLNLLQAALKDAGLSKVALYQGSYNKGVSASQGTHDGGGVFDVDPRGLTPQQRQTLVDALHAHGFAAWQRPAANGEPEHIHAVAIANQKLSPQAAAQVKGYSVPQEQSRSTSTVPPLSANASESQLLSYVQQYYPDHYDLLKALPALRKVFLDLIQQGTITDQRHVTQAIEASTWWQKTAPEKRAFQLLQVQDPTKAKQILDSTGAQVATLWRQIHGQDIAPAQASSIALRIATGFYSLDEWKAAEAEATIRSGQGPAISAGVQDLRSAAQDYLIAVSDQDLSTWAKNIALGYSTPQDYTKHLQQLAAAKFSAFGDGVKNGILAGASPTSYFGAYASEASNLLERPISLQDPRVTDALNQGMGLGDFLDGLRHTPEYQYTTGAKQKASDFAYMLTKTFGGIA